MRLSALLALASKVTLPPNYRYGMSRPGSLADKRKNPPGTRRRPVAVEPISDEDWHLFCGDRVRTSGGVNGGAPGRTLLPDFRAFRRWKSWKARMPASKARSFKLSGNETGWSWRD